MVIGTMLIHVEDVATTILDALLDLLDALNTTSHASNVSLSTLADLSVETLATIGLQLDPTLEAEAQGCALVALGHQFSVRGTAGANSILNGLDAVKALAQALNVARRALARVVVQALALAAHVSQPAGKSAAHVLAGDGMAPHRLGNHVVGRVLEESNALRRFALGALALLATVHNPLVDADDLFHRTVHARKVLVVATSGMLLQSSAALVHTLDPRGEVLA